MTEYKLFTYKELKSSAIITVDEELDLKNKDNRDRAAELCKDWFPVGYATSILDGVDKDHIWLGIGKRGSEVVNRWQEGSRIHPWIPEVITVAGENFFSKDAAPITQGTLYNELAKTLQLRAIASDTIQSITLRPAWQHTTKFEEKDKKFFEGSHAYRIANVTTEKWQSLNREIVSQFLDILPILSKKHSSGLDLTSVNRSECIPNPELDCVGFCGAWYVVEIQYAISQEGRKTEKKLEIRVPVGLLKPNSVKTSWPEKIPFDAISAEKKIAYTYGLDFRFLCEKEIREHGKTGLEETLKSKLTFLNKYLPPYLSFEASISTILTESVNKFSTNGSRTQWLTEQDYDHKINLAKEITLNIVGKEPLAIFTGQGIHLLEGENHIGTWCAKNKLLERLYFAPPWSSTAKWLNDPLEKVWDFNNNFWSIPIPSQDKPAGKQALEDEIRGSDGSLAIPSASGMTNRLASVLGSRGKGVGGSNRTSWSNKIKELQIKDFRTMNEAGQIDFINALWDILTTAYPFDKLPENMYEPTPVDNDPAQGSLSAIEKQYRPLPTAWLPDGFKKENYAGCYDRLQAESGKWRQFGIGFRVEGEWDILDKTLCRLKANGMTQWRLDKKLMAKSSGFYIEGTLFDGDLGNNLDQARFWNGNHDILNQTAVCVSRNLFGATAFPERHSTGDYTLFAVDCSHLAGCDTEQKQIDIFSRYKENGISSEIMRWWRPGEKAFKQIQWENIIGWVRFSKQGQPGFTGWKFKLDSAAHWNLNPDWKNKSMSEDLYDRKLDYLNDELNAWIGEHIVPENFDFVIYPYPPRR